MDCWARSRGNRFRGAEIASQVRSTAPKKPHGGMQRSVDTTSETVQCSRSVFTPPDPDQSILHALIGGEMDQEICPGKSQAQGLWDTLLSSNAGVRLADYSHFLWRLAKDPFSSPLHPTGISDC